MCLILKCPWRANASVGWKWLAMAPIPTNINDFNKVLDVPSAHIDTSNQNYIYYKTAAVICIHQIHSNDTCISTLYSPPLINIQILIYLLDTACIII